MSKYNWPGVAKVIDNRGKPDRRYLKFPEAEASTGNLQDAIKRAFSGGNDGAALNPLAEMMGEWFRAAALCPKGMAHLAAKNEIVKRQLSLTNSEGGYAVPPGFVPDLTADAFKLSQLFQFVRKIPVPSNTGSMPTVGTNCTVSWGSENTDISSGDPAFSQVTWTVHRLNAMVKTSRELVDDSNPDIVQVVGQLFQQAILAERDHVIAMGTGSGQPMGLYSASGITNVNVTTLTYANLVKLKESIDHRYHSSKPDGSFRWFFNQAVKAAIMGIVDDIGRPVFVSDATTGWVPMLLGSPVSIERTFPDNFIGIGDLSYYVWFDRQQLAMESTTEAGDAFSKHQLWIKLTERADGKPALPPTVPIARSRILTGVSSLGT